MASKAKFNLFRGEDKPIRVTFIIPTVIAGWSIQFSVKRLINDAVELIVKTTGGGGITIVNPVVGIFDIQLDSADTSCLSLGDYTFDIQRIDPGFRTELTYGTMTLLQMVNQVIC